MINKNIPNYSIQSQLMNSSYNTRFNNSLSAGFAKYGILSAMPWLATFIRGGENQSLR